MRIAVNTRFLLKDKLEGIGWFTFETLKRITRQHPEHQFIFLFDRPFDENFVFGENVSPVVIGPQARHPFLWYWWFERSVPKALKKHKADLFLSTDGFLSLNSDVPTVLTIHDIAFEHFEDHVSSWVQSFYQKYTPRYAKAAVRINTVSEFTKQDVSTRYGISPEKVDVVYNGANEVYRPVDKTEQEEIKAELTDGAPYFLFTGAIQPRKNIANLFRAFDEFKKSDHRGFKLLIVGRKAWKFREIISVYDAMEYKSDVIFIGHQSAEKLAKITGSAEALVFPSLFEGFGIPIVEAMYAEIPVITSNISSMPEVAGDAGMLVDPNNPFEIADAIKKLVNNNALKTSLVDKGRIQRQQFSWDLTADRYWDSVEKAINVMSEEKAKT